MAGLRSNRSRQRAHYLAQSMLEQSHGNVESGIEFKLAGTSVALGWKLIDPLSELIAGAFWESHSDSPDFRIALLRRSDPHTLPSLEWARPWIDKHQILPEQISYPYRIMIDRPQGLIQVFDTVNNVGAIYIRHEEELDSRSFITPFRLMWSWLANQFDGEIVHAASVLIQDKGILLSGGSGSGKSTFAVHAASHGEMLIADDCTLVHNSLLYPVFRRSKVSQATLQLIGSTELIESSTAVTGLNGNGQSVKSIIDLSRSPLSVTAGVNLDAVLFPRVSPSLGSFQLTARQAYERLTSDSLREIHGGGTRNRLRLARIARSVPSYRALLPPSLDQGLGGALRLVTHV